MKLVCQNCGKKWTEKQLEDAGLDFDSGIPDLEQRIAPGEPVPAGECPDCGALVHAKKPERKSTKREKLIRCAWRSRHTTLAEPTDWMSDEELENVARRIPKNISAKRIQLAVKERTL